MAKDVSKLKIVNDNTEYLFKDLLARNNISSLLGSGILTSLTLNTFFAAPSNKDGLPLFRKITASDLPILNQDTTGIASYAKYLRGRQSDGTYYGSLADNNIIAEWNTKSDNRWYLKAAETYECRVDYATAAEKVKGALKFGSKSFNGSLDVVLLGSDLGSVDLTSELTIIGLKTFSGETYLDSLNANTGLISGNLRVVNGIFGNLTGNVTGNLSGNASTATTLQTARTLTIGNTKKSFDGSSNVSWTLSEIGAASSSHTHNYLPLSGGTVTGQLYLTGLEEGSSDVTDNTELLTSYASNNGFSDTNATGKVYRRDAIHVYNYIKNKLDSVYSAIGHTHSYLPLNGGLLTGNLRIKFGDTDKFIVWDYDGDESAGASWRIGAKGTGSGNTNYFCIESGTSNTSTNTWNNVLNIGQNDFTVYFSQTPKVGSTNVSLEGHTHSYLPLSGGAITGTLNIRRDSSAIQYSNSKGVSQGWLGFSAVDTPTVWMANGSTQYNLIHSGNIGSQSVSNADTLGGLHSSAFKKIWTTYAGEKYIGWVTIAKWTVRTPTYFSPYPFMLSLYRQYNSPSTEAYTFSITFGWDTANIVQVNGNAGDRIIEKLRIAKCSDNLTYRLEMYVNTNYTTYVNLCLCVAYGNYGDDFGFNTVCELSSDVSSTLAEITTAPNYIVGNLSGNAATATNVAWSGVTNKPNFVNSFGAKTGNITIRGGQTRNGSVNLAMSNNELLASIVGLGSNAYTSTAYLPLAGGTMALGEGLKFHSDDNYFGTNLDARIISLLDGNGTVCDGGLIIDERATSNGVEYVTELLRIRDSEFKWKGNDIYHTGNLSPMTTSHAANSITKTNINNWNAVHTWYTTATASDTTDTIDTWKEIEAFVSSFNKGDNLATYLANNYLAKSGGTITGSIICNHDVYNEACYTWRNLRQNDNGGGRADLFIFLQKADGSYNAGFGTYGDNTTDRYIYAGYNEYYGLNLRISATSLSWGDDTILHTGNSSVSNNTITINGTSTTWTDTKVTQIISTSNNTDYRPVILGASSNGSTNSFSTTTSSVLAAVNVYIKPDNGNLYTKGSLNASTTISSGTSVSAGTTVTAATSITSTAGDFYIGGTSGSRCHIKMDTTNKCIKFIFD